MNAYYILLDGKKQGPFSAEDLQRLRITPDRMIWQDASLSAVPAAEIDELKPLFEDRPHSGPGINGPAERKEPAAGRSGPGYGKWIALSILLGVGIAMAIYFMSRDKETDAVRKKVEIDAIHQLEVQKALRELNAEKEAKRIAEERKKLLKLRKSELQSLRAQLKQVSARKSAALDEIDDIKRPHLFRSRAKKKAQLSEQYQIIDRLDAKAASLKRQISKSQAAIDTLSAALAR